MTVARIDHRRVLFQEIEHHLLHDITPSDFLNSIIERGDFKAHPFIMLYRLIETKQPPQHHPEGSVWNHTLLVTNEAAKVKDKSKDPKVFMWAALLHDIGKPPTTKTRKGKITSYDHDKVGAELANEFLSEFTNDKDFIKKVSALIRYHMHILYVNKDLPFADIKGMREQTDIDEVALLGLCDRLGRHGSDRLSEEENIRQFIHKSSSKH